MRLLVVVGAVAALAACCGGDDDSTSATTASATGCTPAITDLLDRIELEPVREALGEALEARIPQA